MIPNTYGQMGLQGMQDIPKTSELWKEEKSKYRVWIILFGLSIMALFVLVLTTLILNSINKPTVLRSLVVHFEDIKTGSGVSSADKFFRVNILTSGSLKVAALGVGMILYFSTLYDAYKKKSFSKISKWSTFIVGVSAFVALLQVFTMFQNSPFLKYDIGVLNMVESILLIVIYIFVSIPLVRVRRIFELSEKMEILEKSPEYRAQKEAYQNMMNNMPQQNMGPFGPMPSQTQTNNVKKSESPTTSPKTSNQTTHAANNDSKHLTDLKKMKIIELKQIAKKLSISGYAVMKKDELIESILRISGEL